MFMEKKRLTGKSNDRSFVHLTQNKLGICAIYGKIMQSGFSFSDVTKQFQENLYL